MIYGGGCGQSATRVDFDLFVTTRRIVVHSIALSLAATAVPRPPILAKNKKADVSEHR